MARPKFSKHVIGTLENAIPPGAMNTFSAVGDLNNNGLLDVVISGRHGTMAWFENTGAGRPWIRHTAADVANMECGGCLRDLTGNGLVDIINGGDGGSTEIWWWENPGPAGGAWARHLIADTGIRQHHETLIGDITNEGREVLVFTNQHGDGGTTIFYVPFPADPTVSPWPEMQIVASGKSEPNPLNTWRKDGIQPEEGLAIGDIDGDGKNELVSGTHWYKYVGGHWEGHKFASGYISTKCAIADIDGDGRSEILLTEGDPCVYGKTQGGKFAWFKPGADMYALWEEHVVEDFLFDAHSLQVGDICGNGKPDVLVAEVGKANEDRSGYVERAPRVMVFENDGRGHFTRHVIDEGTGTHDAVLADVWNRGVLDIVGKPLAGDEMWNVHVWANDRA